MEDGGASDKGEFAATGCEDGKPKFGGESAPPAGGLVADGVAAMGGAPELNSAHRGHFRFVSKHGGISEQSSGRDESSERRHTHVTHLPAMSTTSLFRSQDMRKRHGIAI